MMDRVNRFLALALIASLLAGCSVSPQASNSQPPTPVSVAQAEPAATLVPTESPSPTATATPRPTATSTPTLTPTSTPSGPLLHRTENIMILGVDHRDNDPDPSWRTDTIMIIALDRPNNRVGVVNIPRDLYVDVPGMGKGKINQADYYGESTRYPGGGPALLERVLTATLDIPVQHYVRVQMNGLVSLVDALGGVTVTLDCPLYERTPDPTSPNGLADWNLPKGVVTLDGIAAKKFATYRYVSTDFGRTRRQQQLVWAIRNKALQLDIIPRIPALWKALQSTFVTDLSLLDVAKLASLGIGLSPENVRGLVFSLDALAYDWTDEGASVVVVKDKAQLKKELDGLFDSQPLIKLGQSAPGDCPPPPTPVPTFAPAATATVTGTVTATVTATVTTPTPAVAPASTITPTVAAGQ